MTATQWDWGVTDYDLAHIRFRHKKRTDSDLCRVDGDGPFPCRELRAAVALTMIRKYGSETYRND